MARNLNEELYQRFGLAVNRDKVIRGLRSFLANRAWDMTYPLRFPEQYKDPYPARVRKAGSIILEEICRELFLDTSNYSWDEYDTGKLLRELFEKSTDSFEELLVKTQVFINVFYRQKELHDELNQFIDELKKYVDDFPILGITTKSYKTKASQILPATSPRLDKEIADTLGVLDVEKYKSVLNEFETGVRIFSQAKTKTQLKDVVEDMLGCCDEIVKIVLGDKNKGFKHTFGKEEHKKLGLNIEQKEIFKNLRNWMDKIKHGSAGEFDRADVEMIISMSASFIRFVAVRW